jgi:hypothetical protein
MRPTGSKASLAAAAATITTLVQAAAVVVVRTGRPSIRPLRQRMPLWSVRAAMEELALIMPRQAAQVLLRFVEKTPWAHLDIAGTAMGSPQTDINRSWGSGFGVRLLNQLVANHYEK